MGSQSIGDGTSAEGGEAVEFHLGRSLLGIQFPDFRFLMFDRRNQRIAPTDPDFVRSGGTLD